jgi:hypothetical protein
MTYVRPVVVVVVVLVLSVFASGSRGQNSTAHQHAAPNLIDGAVHPELIPDSTVWRLWLAAVSLSPNATEKERMFQQAHLATLQLTNADSVQLNTILTEFKGQYLALIARYNESAKVLGSQADITLFRQQRDELVSSTRAAIAPAARAGNCGAD